MKRKRANWTSDKVVEHLCEFAWHHVKEPKIEDLIEDAKGLLTNSTLEKACLRYLEKFGSKEVIERARRKMVEKGIPPWNT